MKFKFKFIEIGFPAVDCGDPTANMTIFKHLYLSGSSLNTTIYNTSTVIYCRPGYYWPDAINFKTIRCNANAKWTYYPACTSMFSLSIVLFLVQKFSIEIIGQ